VAINDFYDFLTLIFTIFKKNAGVFLYINYINGSYEMVQWNYLMQRQGKGGNTGSTLLHKPLKK